MKKVIFLFAMVFAVNFAMAQNSAETTQPGDDNVAYINQFGSDNTAAITQIGDKNGAGVSASYTHFVYGLFTGGITQHGDDNTATIKQKNFTENTVSAAPEAGIVQGGDDNTATITQTGKSEWLQEYAWVKQIGIGNTSLQNQAYSNAHSHIYQDGDANVAETQQIGGYNQRADVWQVGNRNNAYQLQGISGSYTVDNRATITQTGDDNIATQYQNGSGNTATTTQEADWNTANLTQDGSGNSASVLQTTGGDNIVNLTQDDGASANIVQDGDNNTLMGIGMDIMATSLNGGTLDLDQIGSYNTLHLQQTNGASATVFQNGITNTAVVIQN